MSLKRRQFLRLSAGSAALGGSLLYGTPSFSSPAAIQKKTILDRLKPLTDDIVPITVEERKSRIEKAQRLMVEHKIDALLLDSGTSLKYFTGISWWPSERTMIAIIPAHGEVKYISPAFEAERLRELIRIGNDVRVWEEHESPYKQIAVTIRDMSIKTGTIGIEERLRFFIFDGIRKEASHLNYTSGDPVTMPCRLIKHSKRTVPLRAGYLHPDGKLTPLFRTIGIPYGHPGHLHPEARRLFARYEDETMPSGRRR